MAVKNYCYLLHPIKFRCKLANVHPNILCENRRTERSSEMIFYEQHSVVFDVDLVDQVHLCYRKSNLGIHNLLKLLCDLIHCYHLILLNRIGHDFIYAFVSPGASLAVGPRRQRLIIPLPTDNGGDQYESIMT